MKRLAYIGLLCLALPALFDCSSAVAPCSPQDEICNNMDEDCDGVTDNDLTRDCSTDCGDGTEECVAGEWVDCTALQPAAETCNHADDDCDGNTDNGLTDCACTGGGSPGTEDCNAIDDDCDEQVDEDLTRTCTSACGDGTEDCVGGAWANCDAPQPAAEACNNTDDDCDGETDNDLANCACTGGNAPGAEDCNGIDDDCNESIDDALDTACSTVCGAGTRDCVDDAWTACSAPVPGTEVCNNHDDDCDGVTDNDVPDCQCTGGNPPELEVCDGIDNNCNEEIDEDDGAGGGCLGFGELCTSFRQCVSQICVGDSFFRHCSQECDSADPSSCPAGYSCIVGPQMDYCLKDWPPCGNNADCLPDMVCTVHEANDHLSMVTECRPPMEAGGTPGDDCSSGHCENNLCLWIDICTEVCTALTDCQNDYLGQSTTCIFRGFQVDPGICDRDEQCPATYTCQSGECEGPSCSSDSDCVPGYACDTVCKPDPFIDYIGECMIECQGDDDCPQDLVCQAGVLSDSSAIHGFCYNPYSGNPTGDICDPGCDHGICFHGAGGNDYCTQLCGSSADCPVGMNCTPGTLHMGSLGSFPDTYTCTQ